MENEKLGQEPAFACTYEMRISGQNKLCYHEGMSKRFYAACAAMQGILANQNGEYGVIGGTNQQYTERLISQSYQFADELLKQEKLLKKKNY